MLQSVGWLVGLEGFLSTDSAGWGPAWVLYGRTLGVGVGCEEPLDQPTPSPCVSLPREDQEQEVSFVLPNRLARLVHAGLVLLMCGPIQASGQRLSVIICLCFIVSAITDEADANSGGQQQHAGSYRAV